MLAVALSAAFLFSSCANSNTKARSSDSKTVKRTYGPRQTGTNL